MFAYIETNIYVCPQLNQNGAETEIQNSIF